MPLPIDPSTPFGQKVERHLRESQVIWLTTVNGRGQPQPSIVWFLWEGDDEILVLSQPHQGKVKAIRQNPNVSLNFDGGPTGGTMIVLNGTAALPDQPAAEITPPAYFEKYAEGMRDLNFTNERMTGEYSQPIRIRIERVRGF